MLVDFDHIIDRTNPAIHLPIVSFYCRETEKVPSSNEKSKKADTPKGASAISSIFLPLFRFLQEFKASQTILLNIFSQRIPLNLLDSMNTEKIKNIQYIGLIPIGINLKTSHSFYSKHFPLSAHDCSTQAVPKAVYIP